MSAACCTRKLHIYVFICRLQTKSDLFELFPLACVCLISMREGIKYIFEDRQKMFECQGSLLIMYALLDTTKGGLTHY